MITWRNELMFECDSDIYNLDCWRNTILDQADAKNKREMMKMAKKMGWTWKDGKCLCPSCSKHASLVQEQINVHTAKED